MCQKELLTELKKDQYKGWAEIEASKCTATNEHWTGQTEATKLIEMVMVLTGWGLLMDDPNKPWRQDDPVATGGTLAVEGLTPNETASKVVKGAAEHVRCCGSRRGWA